MFSLWSHKMNFLWLTLNRCLFQQVDCSHKPMNVWGEAILVQDDWTPYFSITHLLNSSSTKTFIYHIQCNILAENIGRKCHLLALFSFKIKSQYHSMIKIKSYRMDCPMENNSMLIMIVIKCNTMFFMCESVRSKGNLHLFFICKNKCTREKKSCT